MLLSAVCWSQIPPQTLVPSSQVIFTQNGAGAVTRSAESRLLDSVSVKDFGAIGNGVTDDTVAITKAVTYACSIASTLPVGATVTFPHSSAPYLVSSTIALCSYLELTGEMPQVRYTGAGSLLTIPLSVKGAIHGLVLEGSGFANTWAITIVGTSGMCPPRIALCSYLELTGEMPQVRYTGAASLFTIPLSVKGAIHGLVLEGSGFANTWAITIVGTSGNGALSEHIYDNRISNFGDTAKESGGGIRVEADSGKMTVNDNLITVNGTGFLTSGPTDSLNLHDNYFASATGRCIDLAEETGAAQISVTHNNLSCNGGGIRTTGSGTFIFFGNEYEGTGTITNTNSAAYKFIGTGIVTAIASFAALHSYGNYCYWVDQAVMLSNFIGNSCAGSYPVTPSQYGFHNGNSTGSNRFEFNTMYQPTANLYDSPSDTGIVVWPLKVNTVFSGIMPQYFNNAAAIAGGLSVGHLYRNGDVLQIVH